MRLVLDTNVVLDWLVFDDPALNPFRDRVRDGQLTLLTHPPAVEELERVLCYPKLRLDSTRRSAVLEEYKARTSPVAPEEVPIERATPPKSLTRCRDPDDRHFLALAYRGSADMLVSRDKKVLALKRSANPLALHIVDVPEMIAIIERL